MGQFSDLPNELVLKIWPYVLAPEDVVSFARVSKSIYALGSEVLKEQRQLMKKYSFLDVSISSVGYSPVEWLKDSISKPRMAFCVRDLSLYDWQMYWNDHGLEEDDLFYSEEEVRLFEQALRPSEYVRFNDVTDWMDAIKAGDEEPIIAMIVTRLVSLRTLNITFGVPYSLGGLVNASLERMANCTTSQTLSRVETVKLINESEESATIFEWLKRALSLPSVKSVEASHITGIAGNVHGLTSINSKLVEISFEDCYFNSRWLLQFLSAIEALESFSFKDSCFEDDNEPSMIVAALTASAHHSLESLSFTFLEPDRASVGRFRDFQKLKSLEIEYWLLFDVTSPGHDVLETVLPVFIEVVKLYEVHSETHNCRHLIQRLAMQAIEGKRGRLPELRHIRLDPYHNEFCDLSMAWREEQKKMCSLVAVELLIGP